jgi:hypothetical protein
MRCGDVMSVIGQTGQSEAIHSPDACVSMVVRLTKPTGLVDAGGLQHWYFYTLSRVSAGYT